MINHKNLELNIKSGCKECDRLTVVGHFTYNNKHVVVQRRGEDKFFLTDRLPEMDMVQSNRIDGQYVVIGTPQTLRWVYDRYTEPLNDPAHPSPVLVPESTYIARVMMAGAIRIYIDEMLYTSALIATPEYKQADQENRVVIVLHE